MTPIEITHQTLYLKLLEVQLAVLNMQQQLEAMVKASGISEPYHRERVKQNKSIRQTKPTNSAKPTIVKPS